MFDLVDSKFTKFMQSKSTKEMWDKIKNIYEWYDTIKKEKLQTHRGEFESLKMMEHENITDYFLHVDEVVNTIKGIKE